MRFVLLPRGNVKCLPLGQRHDSVGVKPLIEDLAWRSARRQGVRCRLAQSGPRQSGSAAVILPKANRKAGISFDHDMYRWCHLIENTFAKLREFRAVATRYDKIDTSYAATIHLAAAVIASR